MVELKKLELTGPWQFAIEVISEWRRLIGVVIVIMLLGWPSMVIKNWLVDAGTLQSLGVSEQADRQREHEVQDKLHEALSHGLQQQVGISQQILEEIKAHGDGAAKDRQMLSYFTWKMCIQDNGKNANICKQFINMDKHPSHQ